MEHCPIAASIGVLGRKWALLLLRDMYFLKLTRYSEFQRNNPGLNPRTLAMRLRELVNEGYVERAGDPEGDAGYVLTPKGEDAAPILAAFIDFGVKHHAHVVFRDRKPRTLREVFPTLAAPAGARPRGAGLRKLK